MLRRGHDYYEYGHILSIKLIDENEWVAEVEGAEIYNTYVAIREGGVHHHCDCPYDWGGVCKHVVAVLLDIRANQEQFTISEEGKTLKSKVQELSETDLRQFVFEFAKRNPDFRNAFLEEFEDNS